jgi:hypothetical protein
MKNRGKDLLQELVKREVKEGHDMKTAVRNILKSDGSNFKVQTVRNYYRAFSEK